MPSRNELLNETITKLYKLSDKSKGDFNNILEDFDIRKLEEIQDFPNSQLQKILDKIESKLRTGKMAKKIYTGKDFDNELDSLFLKQAVKLAQEKEDEKKEQEPSKEENTEPAQEESEGEETEPEKKIEDVVKDLQVAIIEKFNDVKTFKPGKSEAINFRNSVKKLIEVSESAINAINEYYEKELGKNESEDKEEETEKTSASKVAAGYKENELNKLTPVDEYGVQVQFSSTQGKTKNLNLDKELMDAISKVFSGVIK